jgi:hypothetical protein
MNNFLFDKSKTIVKVKESSAWSWSVQDCWELKIDNVIYHYINKKEIELAEKMKEIMSQEQIDILLPLIEDFGDNRYDDGVTNESMANNEDV